MERKKILIISGPTAIGKTALGIAVAFRVGGEIISADSRQVYRRLEIGTAKPDPEQRAAVRHHLIDIIEPEEKLNAAEYGKLARLAIEDVCSRSKVPIVVAGTGFYLDALLYDLDYPPSVPELRRELEAMPLQELYAELQRVDPDSAGRIGVNDRYRIVRALEVYRTSGRPASTLRRKRESMYDETHIVLVSARELLHRRIEERLDDMLRRGWVDEIRTLLAEGVPENAPCFASIGYRELIKHITEGIPLSLARQQVLNRTRQYAKRQITWFSHRYRNAYHLDTGNECDEKGIDYLCDSVVKMYCMAKGGK